MFERLWGGKVVYVGSIRNHIVYTCASFLLLGFLYSVFSAFVYRPFVEPIAPLGSDLSRMLYGVQGLILVLLVEPVRRLVESLIQYLFTRRIINYVALRKQITAELSEQATVEESVSKVSDVLHSALGPVTAEVTVRFEGQYYRVGSHPREQLQHDHPVIEYFESHSTRFGELYIRIIDEEEQGVITYMGNKGIVYILPFIVERQLLGWLELKSEKKRLRLSFNDRKFMRSIQAILGIGFRRTTLQRHLENRIEELVTLQHIGHTMNSSLNVNETVETVMDAVIELSGADRALMYMFNADGSMTPTIGRGIDDDINLDFTIDVNKSIFKWVAESRQPLVVDDISKDDRVNKDYAAQVKTKGFIAVPVVSKEKLLGIIGVDNLHSGRSVHAINMPILVTLSNNLSIALANSTLFEQTHEFNEQLQTEVDEATKHLQSLLEMKSHFLTLASHQLRTPTTIVKGLLSMLEEDPDMPRDEQRKLIEQAFLSTRRLERIISELLSATELEDTTIKPVIEEFDLAKLIEGIGKELHPLAERRGLYLNITHDEDLHTAHSDQYKLKEAVTNLIDNALRYTQEGGVTVRADKEGDRCVIRITDTGIGLNTEEHERIFEKFQRGADVSDVEPNGTGLGLFIAKRIVEVLQGEISVESEGKGKGATFAISFPLR